MVKITGKRSDTVRNYKFCDKTRQHCDTKLCKKPKTDIFRVPIKPCLNWVRNMEICTASKEHRKWVFWNPCFKIDCRDIY